MAKQKSATKNQAAGSRKTNDGVEPMVVKLAEQLGSLLGRVQSKADGWLESAAVRRQVGQIRDGATKLMNRVNRASAAVRKSVKESAAAKKSKAKSTTPAAKRRSRAAVDAQGKRQRKPPVEELFDPLLGEPMGKQMGQKDARQRRGRG